MSNRQQTSGRPGNQSGQDGITWQQQFIVGFVGWLILQVLSPEEWLSTIGTFLTVEATVLFLVSAIKSGTPVPTSTIQFLLAAYMGYFIVYHGGNSSEKQGNNNCASVPKDSSKNKPSKKTPMK